MGGNVNVLYLVEYYKKQMLKAQNENRELRMEIGSLIEEISFLKKTRKDSF